MMNTSFMPTTTIHSWNVTNVTSQENDTALVTPEEAAAKLIWQVVSPILMIVGTAGNILSIIVLSRRSIRTSGASRYLICLAVADLLVLYTGLLSQWAIQGYGTRIHDSYSFLCKFRTWLVYFTLDLSAWILVSVTVERAISVWKPLEIKLIMTKKVFVVNIFVLVVVLCVINIHFFSGFEIVESDVGRTQCKSNLPHWKDYEAFLSWTDFCLYSLGPFVCHLIGNTVIIVGLVRSSRTMTRYSLRNAEQTENRQRQISSMTVLLLCVNFIYIIFTLPVSIYFILNINQTLPDSKLVVPFACVNLVMYFNHSINFIIYMMSGRRFRAELYAMFGKKPLKPTLSATLSASRSSRSSSQSLASSYTSTVF